MTPAPSVAIFRKSLLSYSETFVADQGQMLANYRPVYCGYRTDDSGIQLISEAQRILLPDHSRIASVSKFLFRHNLNGARQWINAIMAQSPLLIHAHFFNDGIDAVKLGNKIGIPVITTVHGHDVTKYQNMQNQNRASRDFIDRVDLVIAVSDFISEQALACGIAESRLVKHSIGIDLEKFNQEKLESAQPSLLFVGRLVEKKGCTYLLQAAQKVMQRFPELRLTIIGEGKLKPVLQQEAASRKLNCEFVGQKSARQIRDYLAASWLFVAPSITAGSGDAEGLGMVFLEAQALSTPVVSFRSGGVAEAVEHEKTGLLCDEKNIGGLADNIATLLSDSALRRAMGDNGRLRVQRDFDIRTQCDKLEQIYNRLLNGHC